MRRQVRRIATQMQRELGLIINREMRDKRAAMVSVTGLLLSRDLSHARVYITVVGGESPAIAEQAVEVLNHAAGFLRSKLAAGMHSRRVPELKFLYEPAVYKGARIDELLGGDSEE